MFALENDGLTVGAYLAEWLAHMRGRVRRKTLEGYEGLIRLYARPALGALPLAKLRPLDLQRLYGELMAPPRRLSGGTVRNLHLVLSQALSQAERWGLLPRSPAKGAQPPRPRRPEPVAIDAALAAALLSAADGTRFELPVALALSTGMRRGEILALRWADLDPDLAVARVRRSLQTTGGELVFEEPKTRRSRRAVALPVLLRPYLQRQRERQATRRACPGWCELDLVIDRGDAPLVPPGGIEPPHAV